MPRNPDHALLPRPSHDERARQDFIIDFKRFLSGTLRPANRHIFERVAAPRFAELHGREPASTDDIARAMRAEPRWQLWSILTQAGQRQMWRAVEEMLDREEPRQRETWSALVDNPAKRGSLELDADFPVPAAIRRNEIHLQPGGYARERDADDFRAGALYEAGGQLYSRGQGVGVSESKAEVILRFLRERFPDLQPRRILDMGCSAGASSTPYALAFPDAEVFAVDVAAGLLRYAHARAEALGAPVHFRQASVDATGFGDESFDLVVSHNAMHEMAVATILGMFRESRRLLRPGGLCIHQDVPLRYDRLDPYARFDLGWDERHNGEVFWGGYARADLDRLIVEAGFAPADCGSGFISQADASIRWYATWARKAARS